MAAVAAVGGLVSAYGALQQGQATSKSLNSQADIAMQNAAEAESKGQYDASRQQVIAGQKQGQAVASFGASGIKSDSGSVTSVLGASAMNSELDRLNILHGADVRAINYRNQSALDRFGGENALRGSYFQAAGDLLGGFAKTASYGKSASTPVDDSGAEGE